MPALHLPPLFISWFNQQLKLIAPKNNWDISRSNQHPYSTEFRPDKPKPNHQQTIHRRLMKFLKHCDKERVKMAILKHEETFRQQVHELHRLYRVQKVLMTDMKSAKLKRQKDLACSEAHHSRWNGEHETGSCQPSYTNHHQRRPRRPLNLELPAEEYIENAEEDVMLEIEQESDVELTLAIGSSRSERHGTPGTSFSSSSTESSGVKSRGHEGGLNQAPDMNFRIPNERNSPFNAGEGMRQDGVKQPPWLFQCLSLKMV